MSLLVAPTNYPKHVVVGILSTAGTVGEDIIDFVFNGKNRTNKPVKIEYTNVLGGQFGIVADHNIDETNNEITMRFNEEMMEDEPAEYLGTVAVHEANHTPKVGAEREKGLDEEVFAATMQSLTWTQMIIRDPDLATTGSLFTKISNMRTLAMMNSGQRAFPEMGIYEAPLANQNGGNIWFSLNPQDNPTIFSSFNHYLKTDDIFPGVPDQDSSDLNEFSQEFLNRVTGKTDNFNSFKAANEHLDKHFNLFTTSEKFDLMAVLGLSINY